VDELARDLEALVQVYRAQHGLERVGEDRQPLAAAGLHLGMAQQHVAPEPHSQRPPRQDGLRDQQRLGLRELALVLVGMPAVEVLARHKAEHRVAEELQPLVRLAGALPGHAQVRAVRERQLEQAGVVERDPVLLRELGEDARFLQL